MQAETLFNENFRVAEGLLQLYEAFKGMTRADLPPDLKARICQVMSRSPQAPLVHLKNTDLAVFASAMVQVLNTFTMEGGLDFLLRQAVVVTCTALDAFYYDVVRETILTIVRAGMWKKDQRLAQMSFSLEEIVSIENYSEPDFRYAQLLLKKYERGSLANSESIGSIALLFGVEKFWDKVVAGKKSKDLTTLVNNLVSRRNQIAHRADRPKDGEEQDANGLRPISYEWAYEHVHAMKPLVLGSVRLFRQGLDRLQQQIEAEREQAESRKLLDAAEASAPPNPDDPGAGSLVVP
jgi:hypothetical protein